MANFPIQRTNRQPSFGGSGVNVPMSYAGLVADRGVIGKAMMDLGGVTFDEARKWNRLKAEQDVTKTTRAAGMRLVKLAEETEADEDPTTYQDKFESAMADIKSLRPRDKLAAGMYDTWLSEKEPTWRLATVETIKRRMAKTAAQDLVIKKKDYLGKFEGMMTDVALGTGGTEEVMHIAQNPQVIADAGRNGVSADELMISVRSAYAMANQVRSERKARTEETEAREIVRQHGERLGLLSAIDMGDPKVFEDIGKAQKATPTTDLVQWAMAAQTDRLEIAKGGQGNPIRTDYSTMMGFLLAKDGTSPLLGEVGKSLAEQYDLRKKLAEARYDAKKLSADDYGNLVGILNKKYPLDVIYGLQTAFGATRRQIAGWIASPLWGRGREDQAQAEANMATLTWLDREIEKGKTPSAQEITVRAMEDAITARKQPVPLPIDEFSNPGAIGLPFTPLDLSAVLIPDEKDEEARRQALIEGLSDTDRDAVLKLFKQPSQRFPGRTMTVDEFMAKYGAGT